MVGRIPGTGAQVAARMTTGDRNTNMARGKCYIAHEILRHGFLPAIRRNARLHATGKGGREYPIERYVCQRSVRWKGLVEKVNPFEGSCKTTSEIDVSDGREQVGGRHGHGKAVISVLGFRRQKGPDADSCKVSRLRYTN